MDRYIYIYVCVEHGKEVKERRNRNARLCGCCLGVVIEMLDWWVECRDIKISKYQTNKPTNQLKKIKKFNEHIN